MEVQQIFKQQSVLEILNSFFDDPNEANSEMCRRKLFGHIGQLLHKRKSMSSDADFIKQIFLLTQKKFLKNYKQYSTLTDVLMHNNYDCVSSSALFAFIFYILKIPCEIKETDYHIYLIISLSDRQILLETTDLQAGFVDNQKEIARRNQLYSQNQSTGYGQNFYQFKTHVNNRVNLKQLAGLQLYNIAVDQFNQRRFTKAKKYIEKALHYYQSDRLLEVQKLIASI